LSEPAPQTGTGRQPTTGSLAGQSPRAAIPEIGKTVQQLTDTDPYDPLEALIDFTAGPSFYVIVGAKTIASKTDAAVIIKITSASGNIIDQLTVNFTTSGLAQEGLNRRMLVRPGDTVSGIAGTILSLVRCYSLKWAVLAL
jgi:hypothetical protein